MSGTGAEWQGEGRRFLARLALVAALAWGLGRYAATRPGPAGAEAGASEAGPEAEPAGETSETAPAVEPSSAPLESAATGEALPQPRP